MTGTDLFKSYLEIVPQTVELVAVIVIVLGLVYGLLKFLGQTVGIQQSADTRYRRFRQGLGRALLLGLEVLVAADIIRTVVFALTLQNVIILGLLVLIRTFLNWSLEVEMEGRWPWQSKVGEKSNL